MLSEAPVRPLPPVCAGLRSRGTLSPLEPSIPGDVLGDPLAPTRSLASAPANRHQAVAVHFLI